jgi:hypothetical protein
VNWFSEFMGQQREGGTDVDVWTVEELKQVVYDFQVMVQETYDTTNPADNTYQEYPEAS